MRAAAACPMIYHVFFHGKSPPLITTHTFTAVVAAIKDGRSASLGRWVDKLGYCPTHRRASFNPSHSR